MLRSCCTSMRGCCRPEVRLDCWLRGEPEACLDVAMSIGEADDGMAEKAGGSGKSGMAASSSASESGGKRRSSEVKASSKALCWRCLGGARESPGWRRDCGGYV